MINRLLNAGAALVGGAAAALDALRGCACPATCAHHPERPRPRPVPAPPPSPQPPSPPAEDLPAAARMAGRCPVCELPVNVNAGPHEHLEDEVMTGGAAEGTACLVWPTEHDGAVLVTDLDGTNPAVWSC